MGEPCGIDAASLGCLIETLYQAVQDPDAWTSLMSLLCQHLHADSAMIRFYAPDWSEVALTATHGFDPSFNAAYAQHFVHLDPIPKTVEQIGAAPGTLAILDEVIPPRALMRTEFYNDYLRPQDKRHIMGGYLYQEDGAKALFGVQRGHRRHSFEVPDKSLFQVLTPHFEQVLRLHRVLSRTKTQAETLGQTLDTLEMAAFFLDKTGRVRCINARGEAELRSGRMVRLHRQRLQALHPRCDHALQHLIDAVLATASEPLPAAGGAVRLTARFNRQRALTALVTPWRRQILPPDPLTPAVAAAVLMGTCTRPALKAAHLVGAYGLTRAEARLVARLVETCDLGQAAVAAGVTTQTARSYLKSVFRKTECRSQIELITMILTSPVGLWGRDSAAQHDDLPVHKSA